MTLETYKKATKILEEKEFLESERYILELISEFGSERYTEICNRLFELGQEFAKL